MKRTLASLALAAALGTATLSEAAISVSGSAGLFSTEPGELTINTFDAPADPIATYVGGTTVSGSIGGVTLEPTGDATFYQHVGTGGGSIPSSTSSTITLSTPATYFGLYWGSPDTYNGIEFFSGATSLGSFTGATIFAPAGFPGGLGADVAKYVNFKAGVGESFDKIVLTSTTNALETDNHAIVAVPEPGTYALMLAGLAMLGFIGRRRMSS